MSISENSTLAFTRDNEVSYQSESYAVGDAEVSAYEKSPYTDPEIITLEIGANQVKTYVHRMFLSQSHVLEAKLPDMHPSKTISLPELDEIVAHTFVHFLYTGKYQVQDSYASNKEGSIHGYKLGACAYCAATRYKLPVLAALAKEKIKFFGEDLTILDILSVARESSLTDLPGDESWFAAYLEDEIKSAVSDDRELFTKPAFADQIVGNSKLVHLVMKAMVTTYPGAPNSPCERQTGLSTPVAVPAYEQPVTTEPSYVELMEAEEVQPGEASPNENAGVPDFIKEDTIQLDAIEPTSESPKGPEPFTDELGFGTSKTYQKLGKKPDSGETEITADTKASAPAHTRSDSAIASDIASPTPSPVVDDKAAMLPGATDTAPLVVDGTGNSAAVTKKNKKRNKKKGTTATVAGTEN